MKQNLFVTTVLLILFFPPLLFAQNNALTFDGTDDYVQIGTSIVPAAGTNYTIECWFYAEDLSSGNQELLSEWNTSSTDGFFLGFNGSTIRFTNGWTATGITVTSDSWHHIAAVSVGTTNAYVYVDGVLRATKGSALSYTDGGNLVIGQQGNYSGDEYFGGKIDEVRIWDDVRSVDEIRQNMYQELTNPASETNLIAYYKINSSSGTSLPDSKGSNNGTLNGDMTDSDWQTSPAMFGPKNTMGFDGTDDCIRVADDNTLDFGFWIRTELYL